MSERQYKDVSGNPCSLRWLVINEHEWAINQILHRDKLTSERDALQARVKRLEEAGDKAVRNSYFPDRLAVWNEAKEAKP